MVISRRRSLLGTTLDLNTRELGGNVFFVPNNLSNIFYGLFSWLILIGVKSKGGSKRV